MTLVISSASSFALDRQQGVIVQGRYSASGGIGVPSLAINYRPATLKVTAVGKIRGSIQRVLRTKKGDKLQVLRVVIRGSVRGLKNHNGSFSAPALLRFSDGAVVRGTFQGLSGKDQRLSRFFRGNFTGLSDSNFTMRSR